MTRNMARTAITLGTVEGVAALDNWAGGGLPRNAVSGLGADEYAGIFGDSQPPLGGIAGGGVVL